MSLGLLALLGLAFGQDDPWGLEPAEDSSPWGVPVEAPQEPAPDVETAADEPAEGLDTVESAAEPAAATAQPDSIWGANPPPGPWDQPPPSPRILGPVVSVELAEWWAPAEPDPWGVSAPASPWESAPEQTAQNPAPAPPQDEAGWGESDDEAGWGNSSEEAGWGESDDEAGWGGSDDQAGFGDSEDDASWGDDAGWGGDDAAGFGTEAAQGSEKEPFGWFGLTDLGFSFGGAVETRESFWMERLKTRPIASARQSLDLESRYSRGIFRGRASGHAEVDFAYVPKRNAWDESTTQTYGHQLLLRELWVSASPGPVELAVGRQTVAWGDGLLLSPLDVVAPQDLREPGLAELEDLRLPVTMVRAGAYPGSHRFEVMWVPEFDPGFRSPPEGPYGYAHQLVGQAPDLNPSDVYDDPTGGLLGNLIDEVYGEEFDQYVEQLMAQKRYAWRDRSSRFGPKSHQFYFRWRVAAKGLDLGVYAANLLDRQGVIGFPDTETFVDDTLIEMPISHYRYNMLGHSGTASVGKLLVRWEQSLELFKPFNTSNFETQPPQMYVRRGDLLTTMVGVQSAHIPNTTIDIEATRGLWTKEPFTATFLPAEATNLAARVGWTGLRDKLRLSATGLMFGGEGQYGSLVRGDASYAIRDGLWATVGGIHYEPGKENGPLLGFDTHDQLFVQSRFSF